MARSLVASEAGDGVVIVIGRPSLAESADQIAAAAAVFAAAWPDARFLPALRRANVHGAIDLGLSPGLLPGRVSLEDGADWFAGHWGKVPTDHGLDTAGMLEAAAAGELSTLVLLGADPLSDFPDRALATRALERVEFLVSIDTVLNASSMLADVVLAAAGYAERAGRRRTLRVGSRALPQRLFLQASPGPTGSSPLSSPTGSGAISALSPWTGSGQRSSESPRLYSGCTARALAAPAAADGIVVPLEPRASSSRRRPKNAGPDRDAGDRVGRGAGSTARRGSGHGVPVSSRACDDDDIEDGRRGRGSTPRGARRATPPRRRAKAKAPGLLAFDPALRGPLPRFGEPADE